MDGGHRLDRVGGNPVVFRALLQCYSVSVLQGACFGKEARYGLGRAGFMVGFSNLKGLQPK